MTFSVSDKRSGLEYNATTLDKLFCQRKNLLSPRFYHLVLDIIRFYSQAPKLLNCEDDQLSLDQYLKKHHYSQAFIEDHILPMAGALWSGPSHSLRKFPVRYLVAFLQNHQMLQISNRPIWKTVEGGSDTYIQAFRKVFNGNIRLHSPVISIRREANSVRIKTAEDEQTFEQIILACHSDQALRLLGDASQQEEEILGAMAYQINETVLHTDRRLMPQHPKAWASWNALKINDNQEHCTVTYYMNLLQDLKAPEPLLVTLNCTDLIDPEKILVRRTYHHPIYNADSLAAQKRRSEINGVNRTYYAGAYWGWGFHEDGARSAQDVVNLLQEKP